MRLLAWLMLMVPVGLVVDGCSSDVDCAVTLTCACESDSQCTKVLGDGVEECMTPMCGAETEGVCGVTPSPQGAACGLGVCDGDGTCVPGGGGAGGTGGAAAGGAGGTGGAGGQAPVVVTSVSAGWEHTCALMSDATLRCWGRNDDGELGIGTNTSMEVTAQPLSLTGVLEVSAGGARTCARLDDGTVQCWGTGPVGDGNTIGTNSPTPVSLPSAATDISAGQQQVCAVITSGDVYCWGVRIDSTGADVTENAPTLVPGVSNVEQLSSNLDVGGITYNCAVLDDGTGRCWSTTTSMLFAYSGQLGQGSYAEGVVSVTGLAGATQISAGAYHSCAAGSSGVFCWGEGANGRLGDGADDDNLAAGPVGSVPSGGQVTTGRHHSCYAAGGEVWCWGSNADGQLGLGSMAGGNTPRLISTPSVMDIDAGYAHTCAVADDGRLLCWGANDSGQLGVGSTDPQTMPVFVTL